MTRAPSLKPKATRSDGFSVVDLLIVVVIISIIITYLLTQIVLVQKPVALASASQQLSTYLQKARSDSMRRRATETSRMAQITVLNSRFYNVTLDANGDGALDPPILVELSDRRLKMDGPYPRTYMFDAQGKALDPETNLQCTAPITLNDGSQKNVVKISEVSRPLVTSPTPITHQ